MSTVDRVGIARVSIYIRAALCINVNVAQLGPTLCNGRSIGIASVQRRHNVCVGQQVSVKDEIGIHGVAAALGAAAGAGAAAAQTGAGIGVDAIGQRSLLDGQTLATRDPEGLAELLEAIGVNRHCVIAVIRDIIGVVVVQDKAISNEIPVIDLCQGFGVALGVRQVYPIDGLGDPIGHILDFEIDFIPGLDTAGCALQLRHNLVYHMDGEELAGTVGGNPQLIAAVREEIALAQRNLDAGNGAAIMVILCIELVAQLLI